VKSMPDTEIYDLYWDSYSLGEIVNESAKFMSLMANTVGDSKAVYNFVKEPKISELVSSGIGKFLELKHEVWDKYYIEAGKTGKFLAHILAQKAMFAEGSSISLVGFSLGTVVISKCLKELNSIGADVKLEDVILLGGAAPIKDFENPCIFNSTTRVVNVMSKTDSILNYLLKMVRYEDKPIGLNEIKVMSNKVVNVDKSEVIRGHLYYRDEVHNILRDIYKV